MSPEVPELPSQVSAEEPAPSPSVPSGETATVAEDPAALPEEAANPPEEVPAEDPAMPEMPAMPAKALGNGEDADEDDDYEIPEEAEYGQIVKGSGRNVPRPPEPASELMQGVVVGKRHDGVFVDVGQKSEAFLPVVPDPERDDPYEIGQKIEVLVTGHASDGSLQLTSLQTQKPQGWPQLKAAYNAGAAVLGKVTGTIRGGLSVDVGVRAFMPASRSGEHSDEGLQSLVGQEIRARIVQLDEADRNVVLDRRAILEEQRAGTRDQLLANLQVGDRVRGVVRTLRPFGAFVDLGGIDGLLHVSDIAWRRIEDPSAVLSVGQEIEVSILKVDRSAKKIGLGLKQLEPEPWSQVADKLQVNDRISGKVVKIKEYGAFVEVFPGVEGLVHISDMSHSRRVRHPSEIVQEGDVVEVLVLEIKLKQRRISLGLKQALGDPWETLAEDFPVGTAIEGVVRKITSFGAFIEIKEGVDGLLHVSDITSERRLNSPSEVLQVGKSTRVKILEIDSERKRVKLGMKQLEPTEMDDFLAQVSVGETVMGRVVETAGDHAVIEIGEGVRATCAIDPDDAETSDAAEESPVDLTLKTKMLESAWKGGSGDGDSEGEPAYGRLTTGSVHSFKITLLDAEAGKIELARA